MNVGVILAAGRGSRMGGATPKPLVTVEGRALLEQTVEQYLRSSLDLVLVVVGYEAAAVRSALGPHPRLRVVENERWPLGLSSSIGAGIAALPTNTQTILLGLGDMPWVGSAVIDRLLQEEPEASILAPVFAGERGHPVRFSRRWLPELGALEGDRGASPLLKRHPDQVVTLEIPDPGILRDLDVLGDVPPPLPRVVLWGGGDLASGVAHRLYVSGFPVLILELPQPRMLRAQVSFGAAVYAGSLEIEGVCARLYPALPRDWRSFLPVLIDPDAASLEQVRPDVLIDARMLKQPGDLYRSLAPLVVALGPGHCAGEDCHAVVETDRGHSLGRVIWRGRARPDSGVPGVLGGESLRRLVRSPEAGIFKARAATGQQVRSGEVIGLVNEVPVLSALDGLLRGLMQDGLTVAKGEKIGDVDPRPDVDLNSISDKSRAIAGGVLEAIMRWKFGQKPADAE